MYDIVSVCITVCSRSPSYLFQMSLCMNHKRFCDKNFHNWIRSLAVCRHMLFENSILYQFLLDNLPAKADDVFKFLSWLLSSPV